MVYNDGEPQYDEIRKFTNTLHVYEESVTIERALLTNLKFLHTAGVSEERVPTGESTADSYPEKASFQLSARD